MMDEELEKFKEILWWIRGGWAGAPPTQWSKEGKSKYYPELEKRLEAGIRGAKLLIESKEKQFAGIWNTLESYDLDIEAINNLKIFLGEK